MRPVTTRNFLGFTVALAAAGPALASPPGAVTPEQARSFGRSYTQWLYAGDFGKLSPHFSPAVRSYFDSARKLKKFAASIRRDLGRETGVASERVTRWIGSAIYFRTARFSKASKPVVVEWTIAPGGTIAGVLVRPEPQPAPSRFLDYRTKTRLRLPFSGRWFVFWGGRSVLQNYHAAHRDQRFAYDFLVVLGGKTHRGDRSRNQNFYCFGKPILAPGKGTVVAARDGIEDNVPGRMNDADPLGNHVVIDHGNGEVSFLAHLKRGSVQVKGGQTVAAGDPIGACGNSGRSSEAHLHYHLQTTAKFGAGEGLPPQFRDYRADEKLVRRGEPRRGQFVAAE